MNVYKYTFTNSYIPKQTSTAISITSIHVYIDLSWSSTEKREVKRAQANVFRSLANPSHFPHTYNADTVTSRIMCTLHATGVVTPGRAPPPPASPLVMKRAVISPLCACVRRTRHFYVSSRRAAICATSVVRFHTVLPSATGSYIPS